MVASARYRVNRARLVADGGFDDSATTWRDAT
jgi:hypothetical protein